MKRVILRIFRFDPKKDYEYYYKPYVLDFKRIDSNYSIYDVLKIIKEEDIYFNLPSEDIYVKIHNKVVSLKENFLSILGDNDDIVIDSLNIKRAKLDLEIDNTDFIQKFEFLKNICNESCLEDYKKYEFLYYSTDIHEYNDEYLGDSTFIYAYDLINKYPNNEEKILEFIFNKDSGIDYSSNLKSFLMFDYQKYEDIKNILKHKKGANI